MVGCHHRCCPTLTLCWAAYRTHCSRSSSSSLTCLEPEELLLLLLLALLLVLLLLTAQGLA